MSYDVRSAPGFPVRAEVMRFLLADPADVSGLEGAIREGLVNPTQIVAVIGKTHGNGLVDDYTRGYLAQSLSLMIGDAIGESPAAMRERIPFIFSGGVEGVLSPHYVVFIAAAGTAPATGKALAVGVAFTPPLNPGYRTAAADKPHSGRSRRRHGGGGYRGPRRCALCPDQGAGVPAGRYSGEPKSRLRTRERQSRQADGTGPSRLGAGRRQGARRNPSRASVGSGAAQGLRRVLLRRQLLGWRRSQCKRGRRDWHERQVVGNARRCPCAPGRRSRRLGYRMRAP